MAWHRTLPLDEFPLNAPRAITVAMTPIVVVRTADRIHALEGLCPHKFTSLAAATVDDGCIVCPLHDGGFHLSTGAPRPGDEWAGRLPVYAARVVDGSVEVDLP